jgi:hypothetical protein
MAVTTAIKFYKLTAVPTTWVADALYAITNATDTALVELYVTSSSGVPRHVINKAEIQTLITNAIAANNEIEIVADIAARNALSPTTTKYVYVIDATADTTVSAGGATYLYNPSTSAWIKISEAESLDVVLQWENLQGKPTSTPAQIDSAVTNSHTHANKTQLDKIGEDANGDLTYNGNLPHTGWEGTPSW